MNEELQKKSEQFVALQAQKATEVMELQQSLEEQKKKAESVLKSRDLIQKSLSGAETKVESYLTQLGVAKSDKVAIEEHLTEELKSKEKLIVLYW